MKLIHEVIGLRDRVILVRQTETIIKNESNANVSDFFLSFLPFLILEIKKKKHSESLIVSLACMSRPSSMKPTSVYLSSEAYVKKDIHKMK